ncbi:MAG: type II toxin-antitoxin system VapB family antitoxin [Gemmatimonadaceae bacterium]|nr:type II toxin-antitoxin system VapB family antitoxin [Gemmatimonadaceae bacterium]
MALNIKNREADRLVRELAAVTGNSYTDVVLEALREKFQRELGRPRAQRLSEDVARIQQRVAELPVLDRRPPDDVLGYDVHGLPR